MSSCTEPRRGNTSTSPETTTSMPSSRSNPSISASSRNRVHESWAVASFRVKNTWPEGARCRLLTSPRTRMRVRIGFARIVSRMTRASCVTVSACGTPGRFSQVTAIASIQRAFEVVLRAVLFRSLANNDVRLAAREAHGGGDRNGAELDARDPARPPGIRSHRLRDRPQEIRSGDGLLDIHVVRGGLAGREGEGPELEGPRCLQRGHEARNVELTMAPVSGRFEIR